MFRHQIRIPDTQLRTQKLNGMPQLRKSWILFEAGGQLMRVMSTTLN